MGGRGLALLAGRVRRGRAPAPSRGLSEALRTEVPAARSVPVRPAPAPGAGPAAEPAVREQPLVFDTYRMVCALEAAGLPQRQSVALTEALVGVSQAAQRQASAQVVTKSEFVNLRSELSILEKADFAVLKNEISTLSTKTSQSVAEIYTAVERVENRVIKWVVALAGALTLGVLRFTNAGGGYTAGPAVAEPPREQGKEAPRVRLLHV